MDSSYQKTVTELVVIFSEDSLFSVNKIFRKIVIFGFIISLTQRKQ